MKRISIVLGLAVLMAATVVLTAGAALAQAETVQRVEKIPVSGELAAEDNPCTGELITFEGTLHLVHNMATTPNGRQVITYSSTFQGHGVGALSGTQYTIVIGDHIRGIYDPDTGMYIQTNNVPQRWLSQGEGGDIMARSVFHITQQPDGTYTAWVENWDYQCRL
jgi:hypothetical protein